ncbi:MAG: helix-turn-helix domain-containing protein [Pseudanabaenaceae cyanobacterium]
MGDTRLLQIGAMLRQKRLGKGLSLRQVHGATLIPEHHLRAIEAGDWSSLPEPVYVQGFIRKYAQYLGITDLDDQPLPPVAVPKPSWHSPFAKVQTKYFYIAYILLVVVVVIATNNYLESNYQGDRWYREEAQPMVAGKDPSQPGIVPSSPKPQSLPLQLKVVLLGESWMRVTVDGEVVYEGILPEGKTALWSGKQEIRLRVGNAAAVSVKCNQEAETVLGAEGEVLERVCTPIGR